MYERSFGFRRIAEPRRYFGVNFETSLLELPREELPGRARESKSMIGALREAMAALPSALAA